MGWLTNFLSVDVSGNNIAKMVGIAAFIAGAVWLAQPEDKRTAAAAAQKKAIQNVIYLTCGSYQGKYYAINGGVVCDGSP